MMKDYLKKSKELNPLEWTKLMNNYKNMAEEIVLNEYSLQYKFIFSFISPCIANLLNFLNNQKIPRI